MLFRQHFRYFCRKPVVVLTCIKCRLCFCREIILVNDHSDVDISVNVTQHLAKEKLDHIVTVVTPPERLGLIRLIQSLFALCF